jgi:hypothetical protein
MDCRRRATWCNMVYLLNVAPPEVVNNPALSLAPTDSGQKGHFCSRAHPSFPQVACQQARLLCAYSNKNDNDNNK